MRPAGEDNIYASLWLRWLQYRWTYICIWNDNRGFIFSCAYEPFRTARARNTVRKIGPLPSGLNSTLSGISFQPNSSSPASFIILSISCLPKPCLCIVWSGKLGWWAWFWSCYELMPCFTNSRSRSWHWKSKYLPLRLRPNQQLAKRLQP